MKYLIIIEKSKNGFRAYAPDFEGIGVVSDTKEEVTELIKEAIAMHIEDEKFKSLEIPIPHNEASVVLV